MKKYMMAKMATIIIKNDQSPPPAAACRVMNANFILLILSG
jgi:hypothetical protein